MSKKQGSKKAGKAGIELTAAESHELESILDRLSVQNPAGESFRNLLQSLRSSLAERQNLVAALVEEIGKRPSEAGYHAFLALKDLVETKDHRRMMKQTGYRLAQRGYVAPSDKGEPAEKVVVVQKEVRRPLAHFVPADENLWFVAAFIPESKLYAEAVVVAVYPQNEHNRFRRLHVNEVEGSQKRYRELLQIIADKHAKPLEIPVWHAAGLVNDMLELCLESPDSVEARRVAQIFEPYREPGRKPYAHEVMPADEEHPANPSEVEAARLLKEVNVSPLYLSKSELIPCHEKIQGIESSLLSVPRDVQEQRVLDVVRATANELCVGKVRRLWERFFEEQAMWLKLASMDETAALAWKTARHLKSVQDAGENQVAFNLVVVSLRLHWPKEFAHAASGRSEPFQETDSGLILPR